MARAVDVTRALDLFGDELASKPNVVGLGRCPGRSGARGDWDVAVYVERKLPEETLAPADRIPKTLELPAPQGGVRVATQVIEQGAVELEGAPGLEEA